MSTPAMDPSTRTAVAIRIGRAGRLVRQSPRAMTTTAALYSANPTPSSARKGAPGLVSELTESSTCE